MASEVINDPAMNRYELLVDGVQVGLADYQLRDDQIVFVHTEIDPKHRGQGLGADLARGALNLVRAESDCRVVAKCEFIDKFITDNPEYRDLLSR
ncbi:N-acetyltransferase [Salinibacterium sp. UTAS2018]|uniref:GNAT family N-acetyltransferase n=1 Tax=unclassified Salinibacterium TaxID=2632331 RepID=UPI0010096433|nr:MULTISPECIES: GNAT family N-acetyltransferase [unclassified Salinibacterium]MBH0007761.1 N-acetyltransferase [Salinibacterium sp. SWN1162]QAV70892.1 N-acetyltransferase [Salinibacterium sp. UTAS2018]